MDHAAVVAGLMEADLALPLEDAQREVGVPAAQLARHRKAHDPRANDRQVAFAGRIGFPHHRAGVYHGPVRHHQCDARFG